MFEAVWGSKYPPVTVTNPNKVNSTGHLIRLVHFHSHSPPAETSPGTSIIFVQRSLACRAWKGNPQAAAQILRLDVGEKLLETGHLDQRLSLFFPDLSFAPQRFLPWSGLDARPHLPQFPIWPCRQGRDPTKVHWSIPPRRGSIPSIPRLQVVKEWMIHQEMVFSLFERKGHWTISLSGWWRLVVPTPLKNNGVRQLGLWPSQYMENKKCSKPPTSYVFGCTLLWKMPSSRDLSESCCARAYISFIFTWISCFFHPLLRSFIFIIFHHPLFWCNKNPKKKLY